MLIFLSPPQEFNSLFKYILVQFKVKQPNSLILSGGPFKEDKFQFQQLHFHWGSANDQGCEHTIDGKRYGSIILIQFPSLQEAYFKLYVANSNVDTDRCFANI